MAVVNPYHVRELGGKDMARRDVAKRGYYDMPCKPKEPPKHNLKTFNEIHPGRFLFNTKCFFLRQSEDENWFIFFFGAGLLFDFFLVVWGESLSSNINFPIQFLHLVDPNGGEHWLHVHIFCLLHFVNL